MAVSEKYDPINKHEWLKKLETIHLQRTDMNKLIMNYLVTEGFKEAAEKFQQESGITPSIDLNTMDNRIKVRDAILNGHVEEAIILVNQLHPELLDNDRHLYFHLQQLELIELIRAGKIEEALAFAQSRLSEVGEADSSILNEMERTLALLAFEEPAKCPFSDLLNQSHRQKIASEVNAAILKMEHMLDSSAPKLFSLMKMILWAQEELDKKRVKFPHMTDIGAGAIEAQK